MPLCSAGSAHEYLGWNLTAIVTSVQNGDNSPSTAPGIEYLGTVGQRGAAVAADERGHIVHVRFRRHGLHWLQGLTSSPQRPDCVAEDAVRCEPVSPCYFRKTGRFWRNAGSGQYKAAKNRSISIAWMGPPYSKSREAMLS